MLRDKVYTIGLAFREVNVTRTVTRCLQGQGIDYKNTQLLFSILIIIIMALQATQGRDIDQSITVTRIL